MPTGSGPKLMSPLRFRAEEGICPENECPESWMSARNWTAVGDPGDSDYVESCRHSIPQ